MSLGTDEIELPVIPDPRDFDRQSGDLIERLVFNNRWLVLVIAVVATLLLGWQASRLAVNADFDEMMPQSHPYIRNYLDNKASLSSLGNSIRIVVEAKEGDIFDPAYLEVVRQINDKIFLTPGVDRAWMKSIWTPSTRWTEITEEGYKGGPVMPFDYDGSPATIEQFRQNLLRAGIVGSLVANDFKSTLIVVPLLDKLPESGEKLNYSSLSAFLESEVRDKYQATASIEEKARALETDRYRVHIIGFAKLVGDLIDGLFAVMGFFAISALIATVIIYLYTRDIRSTLLLAFTATLGVVWLLGLLRLFGYDLNPYSVLVPFLVFGIGLSHGAQKMNGIMQDIGRGTHKYVAARYTFRRLFTAGLTALLTNVVGFAVLMIIDIPVIRDLALTTSLGVLILIFTKLIFIPVALSYMGVSRNAALRSLEHSGAVGRQSLVNRLWTLIARCTEKGPARLLGAFSLVIGAAAMAISLTSLKIGDLDKGAPELRPDSRYNLDVAYVNEHYGLSTDQFAAIVKTVGEGARSYETLVEQDRLAWMLEQLPEVQAVHSLAGRVRVATSGAYEGSPKWRTIPRNPQTSGVVINEVILGGSELVNQDGSVAPVIAYLKDHKADTLKAVSAAVEAFAAEHNTPDRQFLLAAGSAGIEAATNRVTAQANYRMLGLLYLAVAVLCFVTFRSWRAVVVAMVPLVITSFLCEALMVGLGIGVKVATLPVIALGVGVGVDYALYLVSVQMVELRKGVPLAQAYRTAMNFTGRVVALIGLTMAAGVITWAWSPIKFQADMGILLTFMFIWNMLGALVLVPALSHFLLSGQQVRRA